MKSCQSAWSAWARLPQLTMHGHLQILLHKSKLPTREFECYMNVYIQGMIYLHKSVFQSHGYLSSANCHVDSRWVLKISGFALHAFREKNDTANVSKN